ncbi:hypothetical protein [Intestinimonas massiliensis (ex Afouda et al. 2020)]|uniref:Uncharacterized protein n=1 Tax=Intestinimonas massiliensis (ex Afouda et al. 2020) TaxID=1673721 RepID=A0ABS9MER4_9FIRM|nr:hypothetical protein [Intestinimonas massiliensis (ex Afouda et al. 2020)]MCG4528985.1 hypothetical protein [Intestinimonas massiliensis (ex Afouda et al. 2020)]
MDINVNCTPVSISFPCEACGEDVCIEYGAFVRDYGPPCNWCGQVVPCPNCGHENEVEDWTFD